MFYNVAFLSDACHFYNDIVKDLTWTWNPVSSDKRLTVTKISLFQLCPSEFSWNLMSNDAVPLRRSTVVPLHSICLLHKLLKQPRNVQIKKNKKRSIFVDGFNIVYNGKGLIEEYLYWNTQQLPLATVDVVWQVNKRRSIRHVYLQWKTIIHRHQTPPRYRHTAHGRSYTVKPPCFGVAPTTAKRDVIHKAGST